MPKTLLDDKNKGERQYRNLCLLLNGHAKVEERGLGELSRILGVSQPTVSKYLKNPEKAPLEKLLKLARNLHIPIDDLRGSVQY